MESKVFVDLIVWEDEEENGVYVSAVSVEGCRVVASILGMVPGMLCAGAQLEACPDEFMSHVPKDLEVYFYKRKEGSMTNMKELASKQLQ